MLNPYHQPQVIIEMAKRLGIETKLNQRVKTCSYGEQQRIAIIRSLMQPFDFLLLDEPFAGIDPIAVGEIQNIIRELKAKGIGVLITDHNVRETLGICDYAYILKDGQIQVAGTSIEIANSELAKKFYLGENFRL